MADVAEAKLSGDLRVWPVTGAGELGSEVADRLRRSRGDIERTASCGPRVEGEQVRPGDVAHLDEVAELVAILKHARSGTGLERAAKNARDPCVGGIARHSRSVTLW